MFLLKVLNCLIFVCIALAVQLPDDIKKCHFGDDACMTESINLLIRRYARGNPDIGLQPLDKIKVEDITLISSPGPVHFYYKIRNQVIKGFENATVTGISGFERDPEMKKIEIALRIPRLLMEGTYDIQGRGIIVYTNSTGPTKSDLQNVRLNTAVKGYIEYRNNKRYLRIYDLVPQIELDRWILLADDLYKENTDLTVILNRVVNENWLEFWNEVEPTILPAYSRSINQLIQNFFDAISYDDLFLP